MKIRKLFITAFLLFTSSSTSLLSRASEAKEKEKFAASATHTYFINKFLAEIHLLTFLFYTNLLDVFMRNLQGFWFRWWCRSWHYEKNVVIHGCGFLWKCYVWMWIHVNSKENFLVELWRVTKKLTVSLNRNFLYFSQSKIISSFQKCRYTSFKKARVG